MSVPDHDRRLLFVSRVKYCCAVFEDQPSVSIFNVYDDAGSEEGLRLRRRGAAHNFCIGADTHALELNGPGAVSLAEENARLRRQRNELKGVVKRLMAWTGMDECEEEGAEAEGESYADIWREARKAIKENTP